MSFFFSKLACSDLLCGEAGCKANAACAARWSPCGELLAGSDTKIELLKTGNKKTE